MRSSVAKYKNQLLTVFEPDLVDELLQFPVVDIDAKMIFEAKNEKIEFIPIIMSGSIRAIQHDMEGKEVFMYNIMAMESCILSINAAIGNNVGLATAISNEETSLMLVPNKKAGEWMEKYTSWRNFTVNLYEKRLQELVVQNHLVSRQNTEITRQKQQITDSILYAQRIQNAVLPPIEMIDKLLPEYFVLYKPKDIVSGDYYWMTRIENKTIVVVADCTGHGVPGAFMSMLGISLLNQIVNSNRLLKANEILEELRNNVKASLRQSSKPAAEKMAFSMDNQVKDGMDLALMVFDFDTNILEYAGAYNPLYIIRDNELIQIKADRMPIGIHITDSRNFTKHKFEFKKGDLFYTFSDGYVDQFGGKDKKKFMSKPFQNLILDIHKLPMDDQKDILEKKLEKWQGELDQIDDILVFGIRV